MRRVLLATATIVALVAVSFGVGWVVSGTDDRTSVRHQPAVAQLKPLPVPRVIIANGPWADPRPPLTTHRAAPRLPGGLLGETYRLLLLDPRAFLAD